MPKRQTLGDLQLAIMQVLWTRGEGTVVEVHADLLVERNLAPTTIATMLVKMENKGVVAHRTEGRRYVYRPTLSESDVRRTMVDYVTERLFSGNPSDLLAHLVEERQMSRNEIERLEKLIDEHRPTEED